MMFFICEGSFRLLWLVDSLLSTVVICRRYLVYKNYKTSFNHIRPYLDRLATQQHTTWVDLSPKNELCSIRAMKTGQLTAMTSNSFVWGMILLFMQIWYKLDGWEIRQGNRWKDVFLQTWLIDSGTKLDPPARQMRASHFQTHVAQLHSDWGFSKYGNEWRIPKKLAYLEMMKNIS